MSVRNLRAMFENKTQESPPDRGRSPAGTESPRPLSKVRTSFVAIEKDGRIGLQQRNPSETSSISGRKLSGGTEVASSVDFGDNTSTNASSATPGQPEPIKEVATLARSDAPPKGLAESPHIKENPDARKSDYASHLRKSQGAGDQVPAAPEAPEAPKAAPAEAAPAEAEAEAGAGAGAAASVEVDAKKANGVEAVEAPAKPTPAAPAPAAAAPAADEDAKKINGMRAVQTPGKATRAVSAGAAGARPPRQAAPAEPAAAAPPGKVASKQTVKSADPVPQPKPTAKPTATTSHPPTTPKAVAKPNTERKAVPSVSPGGFVKPRPKSPTRPVKLPASLTTHTTASGSRTRTAGSVPPPSNDNSARSTSRSKALQRSSSAAGRQRPSVGPPPKLPAKDHPVVKKDAKVDEGFLARMMRPTQASASKKNEKVPTTPPRRPAAATSKKSASAKSATTRRPVSKTTSASTSTAPSPDRTKAESSSDGDIATAIESMSVAENDQEPPRTPEREAAIPEELEEEKAGAAAGGAIESEVEEAAVPLANGAGKGDTEAVSRAADTGDVPEQEEW